MKQNKYDEPDFFHAYAQMPRSVRGLEAAGEWHVLKTMLPDLHDKAVLDLGCGYGWHCRYVREQRAQSVTGVDLSAKMLQKAQMMTDDPAITYIQSAIEDIEFAEAQFDVVLSSLALHYVEPFAAICKKISDWLKPAGTFVFSVEHPIFTSRSNQDWYYDDRGNRLHWPIDHYQSEGRRETTFFTDNVVKYHRTVSTYMNSLIQAGFGITAVKESEPSPEMLAEIPEMADELRRPMFLMIAAEKKA